MRGKKSEETSAKRMGILDSDSEYREQKNTNKKRAKETGEEWRRYSSTDVRKSLPGTFHHG